jgi:hypothetical protein
MALIFLRVRVNQSGIRCRVNMGGFVGWNQCIGHSFRQRLGEGQRIFDIW